METLMYIIFDKLLMTNHVKLRKKSILFLKIKHFVQKSNKTKTNKQNLLYEQGKKNCYIFNSKVGALEVG